MVARGEIISVDAVLADILARDAQDAAREIAPMKPADDARVIDSTGRDLDEVVTLMELENPSDRLNDPGLS